MENERVQWSDRLLEKAKIQHSLLENQPKLAVNWCSCANRSDTDLGIDWLSSLLELFRKFPKMGSSTNAITNAGNDLG